MLREPEPSVDWEITVDKKHGMDSMRTVKKRYFTVTKRDVAMIFLAIYAGTWAGIFVLGFWAAGALK